MSTNTPMQGTLTALFETSTEKGAEISRQFNPFMFEFHQFLELPQDKKDQITQIVLDTMKKLVRLADGVDRYHEFEKEEEKKLIEKVRNDKSSVLLAHAAHSDKLEGL